MLRNKNLIQENTPLVNKDETLINSRNSLPDNALRMIQVLEKIRKDCKLFEAKSNFFEKIINNLMAVKNEKDASDYFRSIDSALYNLQISHKPFQSGERLLPHAQFIQLCSELHLASLSNEKLLGDANTNCNDMLKREIEGRLLRTEKSPEIALDIEKQLLLNDEQSSDSFKYNNVLYIVREDFSAKSEEIYKFFSSKREDRRGHEKGNILENLFSTENWARPDNSSHYLNDPSLCLLRMRDQLLGLPQKLSENKEILETDRRKGLSILHDILIGLGCIILPPICLPITFYFMYRSNRDKGTVFFTHAPESMLIAPAVEKSLKKLGQL